MNEDKLEGQAIALKPYKAMDEDINRMKLWYARSRLIDLEGWEDAWKKDKKEDTKEV